MTSDAEREALLQRWRDIREGRIPLSSAVAPESAAPAAAEAAPAAAAPPPPAQQGPQLAGESFGKGPSRPQRGASGAQLAYRAQRFGVEQPKPSIGPMDLSGETQAKLLQALESENSPAIPAPVVPAEGGVGGAVADYARRNAAKEIGTGVGSMLGHPFLGRLVGAGVDKALQNPEAFKSLANKMATFAKVSPQLMGKFGPPLLQASMRGADALSVTHYQLSQTPEYQQLMRVASQAGRPMTPGRAFEQLSADNPAAGSRGGGPVCEHARPARARAGRRTAAPAAFDSLQASDSATSAIRTTW